MVEVQKGYWADRNCKLCEGTGVMYVPSGKDDIDSEMCDCVQPVPDENEAVEREKDEAGEPQCFEQQENNFVNSL